jgi:hypothetical protein
VVFLLGYEPEIKSAVASMLTSIGASILQPVPTNHWLVKGTAAGIRSVQQTYPTVTSVRLRSGLLLPCYIERLSSLRKAVCVFHPRMHSCLAFAFSLSCQSKQKRPKRLSKLCEMHL